MKRSIISGLFTLLGVAAVAAVVLQHRQLTGLRHEQQRIVAQLSGSADGVAAGPTHASEPGTAPASAELLRLRSEVSALTERCRGLAGISNEHEHLLVQIANRGNNAAGGTPVPPGYIRKRDAQMVGFNTPEATLQSFLWALQNHDTATLLQAITPSLAQKLGIETEGRSTDEFFKGAEGLPGMRIISKNKPEEGRIDLEVEMLPSVASGTMQLQQIDGRWRLSQPF